VRGLLSTRRSLLLLAALLTFVTAVYSGFWAYYIRTLPQSTIGVAFRPFSPLRHRIEIFSVAKGSPAEQGGLLAGDAIVGINGRPLDTIRPWEEFVVKAAPNSAVIFAVERASGVRCQCVVRTPSLPPELIHPTFAQTAIMNSLLSYPLFFLAVIGTVLFFRCEDRNAWLLAFLFVGFIALAPWVNSETEPLVPVAIRRFALTYQFTFRGLLPALFYYFFAVFPVQSPLDRVLPWLKHALTWAFILTGLPFLWTVASTGSYAGMIEFSEFIKRWIDPKSISVVYTVGGFALGLTSLAWNAFSAPTAEAKRKIRVMMLGTAAGTIPLIAMTFFIFQSGKDASPLSLPFYVWVVSVACLTLVPLSFAYAVIKHRVMEIPGLLKRGARYILVRRGFALFITLASIAAAWVFVRFFFQFFPWISAPGSGAVVTVGMAGAGIGGLIAFGTARIQEGVRHRLDRAFFRGAYDARQILEELSEKIRTAGSGEELAKLLEDQITRALHPSSLTLYVESAGGQLQAVGENVPFELRHLSGDLPLLKEIARRGRPVDVPPPTTNLFVPFSMFAELHSECIIPIPGRDGRLVGAILLGPRLSEEPYSGEDKRLLSSVANQAGVAIESIRLAERMAQQLIAERRTAYESEMARQVQNRLLPQRTPAMQTLDYAGVCIQARSVGGDYYDFLDLGTGRIALVLADVSGKGMPAALLMAGLQATMRTHCTAGLADLATTMRRVNQLLYESTAAQHFVTLFVAEYSDESRRLRYVNCGHNSPILLRPEGVVRRLPATACVLGAFQEWDCAVEEISLEVGDVLALFTDGVTEAASQEGDEFGEERLISALLENRGRISTETLASVTRIVQGFGGNDQADDLTLIIARVVATPW
jgi:phosphoserine phosphatase RsbU/P